MPSGRLCNATAKMSIVGFFMLVGTPSGSGLSRCRCGRKWSNNSRNPMPARKPIAAGSQPTTPCPCAISMDGISRLHTLAAIITPAANPSSIFCTSSLICSFMKKAKADPSVVPARGRQSATSVPRVALSMPGPYSADSPALSLRQVCSISSTRLLNCARASSTGLGLSMSTPAPRRSSMGGLLLPPFRKPR